MTAQPQLKPGRYDHSEKLFRLAKNLIPGGVNSPVRGFGAVGGAPVFMAGAEGAIVQDMDENQYVDYVGSWGPMILGHSNKQVIDAVKNVAEVGTSFGAPTDRETALADFICERHEHIEQVRLVNSGTEATMSAVRLARGYTGRERVIKCDGCYHGHVDSLLVAAGSGAATHAIPGSAGVPDALAALTNVVPYNDLNAMRAVFEAHPKDVACVIIEPVAGNMGCIPPQEGYLQGLRELCDEFGALLILDEVMTGFRVDHGSAQGYYNVRPDLACFGKIVGGGLPLAAYGGRRDIMEQLSPLGPVYQAGTLSGNPLAVAAGMATVEQLTRDHYKVLEEKGAKLEAGLRDVFTRHSITHSTTRVGSMMSVFFSETAPTNFKEVKSSDVEMFKRFFHGMLDAGIYLPPSPFEAWFIGLSHSDDLIDLTLKTADNVAKSL